MVDCYFNLNWSIFSPFGYNGVSCTCFSGNGIHRNNPDSTAVASNGPIPTGVYYIVDRQSGGTLGGIRDALTGRSNWFALYRDDGTIDDETFIESVRRGEFRMHPTGPSRTSLGCITFQYAREFDSMRSFLRSSPITYIPDTGTITYGTVTVGTFIMPSLRPGEAVA